MTKEVKNIETKELSLDIVSCKITTKLKKDTEKVLNRLGLGYSEAIKIYFNQIVLTNSIPFDLTIPNSYVEIKEKKITNKKTLKKS
jgi:addiction module RelB/DinJ family antitoxin